jgi:hypothetical protein
MKNSIWIHITGLAASLMASAAIAATPATDTAGGRYGGAAIVDGESSAPGGPYDFRRLYDGVLYDRAGVEFGRQGPLDWPAAEVREVALARARTVIARYEEMRARDLLGDHIDRLNRQFERSPEYVNARQADDEAWAAYQSAVAAVMARLNDDPDYQASVRLAADVGGKIEDFRYETDGEIKPVLYSRSGRRIDSGAFVSPVVVELASSKLSYARRASEMRAQALASDAAVAEARARLQTTSARMRAMRGEFADRVRDDARVLAMRDTLTEARIAHMAAAAYEDSARFIRRLAIRYATFLHRNDASPYFGNTYDNYYGYGGLYDVYGTSGVLSVSGGYGFKRR